jgi:16S rRNA pseudouridine516 synthase
MRRACLGCSDNALLMMQLQDILFSQGFGTRRVCSGLVQQGLVKVQVGADFVVVSDPAEIFEPWRLTYTVQGERWVYQAQAFLMLHKPAGFECSHKPGAHPSIYTLLPGPLRMRGGGAAAGVQAVGRLDHDTTGLLLLSDDGKFIHRMTSPRHHVPKVYQVRVKHTLEEGQLERLRAGVVLDDDPKPVRAAACSAHSDLDLELTLTEGKYHQVKRMVAAVGNRVEGLHRSRIGTVSLPPELLPGQWRWLTEAEVADLTQKVPAPTALD